MTKLLWRFLLIVLAALGVVWLADRPGSVTIQWLGREIHLSVLVGVIAAVILFLLGHFVLRFVRMIFRSPQALRGRMRERKTHKAYEALSRGIIAAGAGDAQAAARHAALAAETLVQEPLVKLLGAQAAQLRGDRDEVRRVFETMAQTPDTELLGLRGLFTHARDAADWQMARKHAEAAHRKNNRLPWANVAVLQSFLAHKDFESAARNVALQSKLGLMPKEEASKKQAALLCAAALACEDADKAKALALSQEALILDQGLVPAALLYARVQLAHGNARKATKTLRSCWGFQPHRELARMAARVEDDGAEKQFERVRDLIGKEPNSDEGRFALAEAAILAGRHEAAREVLKPLLEASPQAGVCGLMASIEDMSGDKSKSREWLAKALSAPRDPLWVSDSVVVPTWTVLSPVTGEIAPSEWKVPFQQPTQVQLQFSGPTAAGPLSQLESPPTAPSTPRLPDDPGIEQSS